MLQQNVIRQSSDMQNTVNKWTPQQGEQIHAKNRKIYNFDLKLSISIFHAWFMVVMKFTWCSNPGHTLEGIYAYQSFSMS